MRRRLPDPARHRMTVRLSGDLFDDLGTLADEHTFGNRSAMIERILTEGVAAAKAPA